MVIFCYNINYERRFQQTLKRIAIRKPFYPAGNSGKIRGGASFLPALGTGEDRTEHRQYFQIVRNFRRDIGLSFRDRKIKGPRQVGPFIFFDVWPFPQGGISKIFRGKSRKFSREKEKG